MIDRPASEGRHSSADVIAALERQNAKLAKINAALMNRVERSMEQHGNAFSMFQAAIGLETQVRVRTEELKGAMTRLERLNDQLIGARDSAEQANRFKTRFFTAVGHDLLQPLHAARLSLSAIADADVPPPQWRKLIGQIDHSLTTVEDLLRTILDLSRLEAGVVNPSLQTIDVRDLFQSLVVDLAPIAKEKNLILQARDTDVAVTSDPLMLRRMLQNLLANAVQYTDKGRILLATRRRGRDVRIEVWDTGPGISAQEQGKIFGEFQRGSAAERSRGGGFGIGLAIIARMAEALHHRVDLCSRVGHGTCFSVTVPYAGAAREKSAAVGRAQAAIQGYGLASTKAIVVDNDPLVLDGMRGILQRWGFDARFASGVEAVRELLAAEPEFVPDIVLADFHLDDGTTGLEAIEVVRQLFGAGREAIVITGDHSQEVAERVQAARCDMLRKPVRPAELRALILHLLT